MKHNKPRRPLTVLISLVWLINGLFCKLLNLVPRHQEIVSEIMGTYYAGALTKAIGIGEILITAWILTGIRSRTCALFQMLIVMTMNIVEFIIVPDLLLFGRLNLVFALLFAALIYWDAFVIRKLELEHVVGQENQR